MSWPQRGGEFRLGDLAAQQGGTIRDAKIVWQTHGTLSAARDNVVLYPCSYTAQHPDMAWLIGPDGILDPTRWFIVIPDMFSNGLSSGAAETADYPAAVTAWDNVQAQRRLLLEQFGIERLAAVYGFSMGAQQAYHWAALFPDAVARAFVVCGSARTAVHNKVFLSSLLRTLEAAPEHLGGGRFSAEPRLALRAFAHGVAGQIGPEAAPTTMRTDRSPRRLEPPRPAGFRFRRRRRRPCATRRSSRSGGFAAASHRRPPSPRTAAAGAPRWDAPARRTAPWCDR
jgi:homoserine O-acetyltransferase